MKENIGTIALIVLALVLALILATCGVPKPGTRYLMPNGVEATLLQYYPSRDYYAPTLHLQWYVNGIIYDGWFRASEVTKISQ
jgi:hypothetical protein